MNGTDNCQKRSTNDQKIYEAMLNIPGHKGSANQNIEIPPHSSQNGCHQ
jgi:hypothetical protein